MFYPSASPRQSGFTLIELLVVISIISLLVSILLPALAGARRAVQGTQCSSNLRQVAIGLESYLNDSDGRFPLHYFNASGHANHPGLREYVGLNPDPANLEPYRRDTVFTCPSLQQQLPTTDLFHRTYSQNEFLCADYGSVAHERIITVPTPHQTMFLMDGRYQNATVFYATRIRWQSTWSSGGGMAAQLIYPHQSQQNAVYLDGHVNQVDRDQLEQQWNAGAPFWGRR